MRYNGRLFLRERRAPVSADFGLFREKNKKKLNRSPLVFLISIFTLKNYFLNEDIHVNSITAVDWIVFI